MSRPRGRSDAGRPSTPSSTRDGSGATAGIGRNRAARGVCAARYRQALVYGCPCIWACPSSGPASPSKDAEAVRPGLARFEGLPVEPCESTFPPRPCGRISALAAGNRASQQRARSRRAWSAEWTAISTPDTMEWLDANRQLAGSVSRSAFVPAKGLDFAC